MRPALRSDERSRANEAYFAEQAERLALLCSEMATRFLAGGRLLAFARSAVAQSDARHVAVEFVHPVIVGKRALPAFAVVGEPLAAQAELLVEPHDIVMPFDALADVAGVVTERGALLIAFPEASEDAFVEQEVHETAYHVLWELVHVFLEHRSVGATGGGAASFLYPFLDQDESSEIELLADVQASVLAKAAEIGSLRTRTLTDNADELEAAAGALRDAFATGGRVLALGNGGSATDAMDVVADLRAVGRPALDLAADPAILTAIANDIGVENVFARQVIAYGRPEDVLLAISTSGGSANVIAALAEARRRGLATIALVGYDGGRILQDRLADHVIVARSEHIPRIQEAQASAYHVLLESVR